MRWFPIASVPRDGTPVLLADYEAMCLLTGEPHVFMGRYVGDKLYECSYAATNENGTPTHWSYPPEPDAEAVKRVLGYLKRSEASEK